MPIYEFRCTCGHMFEKLCRSSETTSTACPKCGEASEKVFSSFSVGRSAPVSGCGMGDAQPGSGCGGCRYAGQNH